MQLQSAQIDAAIAADGGAVQGDRGGAGVGIAQGAAAGEGKLGDAPIQWGIAWSRETELEGLTAGQPVFVDHSRGIDTHQAETAEAGGHA